MPTSGNAPLAVVVDEEQLATIEEMVGREGLQAIVDSLLSDLKQRLAAITALGAERNVIEREAHALVSQAGNLGLMDLSLCSRQLTDACRSGADGDIPKLVQELFAAAERVVSWREAEGLA